MAKGGNSITQRIALEGGDEIKRQLADVGAAGETAFQKIKQASEGGNETLSRISGFVSNLKSGFGNLKSSLQPAVDGFSRVTEAGKQFGESVANTANNLIPHFRQVTELALAGSVVGFIELAKRAGEAAHEIQRGAEITGLSTDSFQAMSFAANKAGVGTDQLITSLARLNRSLGEAKTKQKDTLLDIAGDVFKDVGTSGVSILNGVNNAAFKVKSVVREISSEASGKLLPFANQMKSILDQAAGGKSPLTLQQINSELTQAAGKADETGAKLRDLAGLKPLNATEAFKQMKDAGDDLAKRLRLMGVEINNTDGSMRSMEQIVGDLAENFEHTADKAGFAANGAKIFGKGFKEIIPLLAQGRDGIKNLELEFTKSGIGFSAFAVETGIKLRAAFVTLETSIKNVVNLFVLSFAPIIQPALEAITKLVQDNAQAIQDWAKGIASNAKPAVEDLIKILQGASSNELTTAWAVSLKSKIDALPATIAVFKAALDFLLAPFNLLAGAINLLTGSQLEGWMILITASFLSLSGILGIVTAGFNLLWVAAGAVAAVVGWPATIVLGLILLFAWIGKITGAWDDVGKAIGRVANWALEQIGWIISKAGSLADIIATTVSDAWDGLGSVVGRVINFVLEQIGFVITKLNDWARAAVDALSAQNSLGDAAGNPFDAAAGLAGGGSVHGPAGHDKVHIRATRGEFVQRLAAVRYYGVNFMSKINRLELPRGGILGFAMGGLVGGPSASLPSGSISASSTDRVAVDLTFNGEAFADMLAPRAVATKLVKFARGQKMRSAGPAPSWAS